MTVGWESKSFMMHTACIYGRIKRNSGIEAYFAKYM